VNKKPFLVTPGSCFVPPVTYTTMTFSEKDGIPLKVILNLGKLKTKLESIQASIKEPESGVIQAVYDGRTKNSREAFNKNSTSLCTHNKRKGGSISTEGSLKR
ncbi:Protein of unknown function, partial [Gryllus bimaculatus]